MAYATIQPPFTLEFTEMSKAELKAYAAWFHAVAPARIAELEKAVRNTPGYHGWEPDQTPDSLGPLGRWLEGQVEMRKKTESEIAELHSQLTLPIDVPREQLTNRTFSIAMDLGMYFGQVVLKSVRGTRWDQPLGKSRRWADYGQPVIVGNGRVPLNPVRIMVTAAYSFADKRPTSLRELFNAWQELLM